MRCSLCNEQLEESESRYAFEDVYCESCFDLHYQYCSHCECLISRADSNYDSNDDPICNTCYANEYDDNSPENPPINQREREEILNLSRHWLLTSNNTKRITHK